MPLLITLEKDGPLGPAGAQVWVNDPADARQEKPAKSAAPAKKQQSTKK